MHFGLSEEQQLLQETVRGFVAGECPPPRLRELFDAGTGHDPALWKGLAEMGVAGLLIPEARGGAGLGVLELAVVMEELGAGALPGPLLGHALASLAVLRSASDAQQAAWLPALASGEEIATVALAESSEVEAPEDWTLALEGGRLSGVKAYVPHAEIADHLLVGLRGGAFARVERGAQGLTIEDARGADRTRPISRVTFRDTPAESLPGEACGAHLRDVALVLLAADAFGAAQRLVHETTAYAKTRQQFDSPIAQFQAVKHSLASMVTEVELSRGLWWYAAHALDHMPDEAPHAAAIAKAHLSERAVEVARAAVELHGGLGFTWECDVQLWFKRIVFDRAFCGTPEHHHARIAELGAW